MFCKKGVILRNFTKFTGKHLCQSLFFTDLRPATLLKKKPWHRCFFVNFVKFLRTPFLKEHLWWLILKRKQFVTINESYSKSNGSNNIREQKYRNSSWGLSSSRQQLDTIIDVKRGKKNKKTLVITGDSIIRNFHSCSLNQTAKLCFSVAKSLLGATTQDIVNCTKPSVAWKSDMMILHARTYNLRSD